MMYKPLTGCHFVHERKSTTKSTKTNGNKDKVNRKDSISSPVAFLNLSRVQHFGQIPCLKKKVQSSKGCFTPGSRQNTAELQRYPPSEVLTTNRRFWILLSRKSKNLWQQVERMSYLGLPSAQLWR